ncbi:MAG: L,D-transpeptidase [Anaerolineales bacterium]|nr:L,D-transpeptidase [Anaerolineales bacterium]
MPSSGTVEEGEICTFDMQMERPDLCPADGPSAQRAEYWRMGLLPRRGAPALPLDPALAELDRGYGRAGGDVQLGFYLSVEDAVASNPHHWVYKGLVYVSIVQTIQRDEGTFYRTGDGFIVRGDEVTPVYIAGQFNGVTLAENPVRPFGWVIPYEGVYPSRTPGGPADPTADHYPRYSLVEVFETRTVETGDWYLVGINQWIQQKKVGLVFPDVVRPAEIPAGVKWIGVNLFEQSLTAYEGERMVFATLVASGVPPFWTRPGVFQVKKKYEMQSMSGSFEPDKSDYYYLGDVPWVMYFDHERAIHGEYWHNNLGGRRSHGCVNVAVGDGHWLFDWAPDGTSVYVYDPSGKTPTDDESYKYDK